MSNFTFQKEDQARSSVEHPDYSKNANWGAKFLTNYNSTHDDKFFSLVMSKNSDSIKYYFMFSFFVPLQYGTHLAYGNAVDPNQDNETFMDEFKNTFCGFNKLQRKWDQKKECLKGFKEFDPK